MLRIEGCVSGTLMYVLSEVWGGRPFSKAVREAVARGYAEPDPRDDFSGQRCGPEGADPRADDGLSRCGTSADDLVPATDSDLALPVFLEQLPEFDAAWRQRVAMESARGRVLRYVVSATPEESDSRPGGGADACSAMGAAAGTRNIISSIRTV